MHDDTGHYLAADGAGTPGDGDSITVGDLGDKGKRKQPSALHAAPTEGARATAPLTPVVRFPTTVKKEQENDDHGPPLKEGDSGKVVSSPQLEHTPSSCGTKHNGTFSEQSATKRQRSGRWRARNTNPESSNGYASAGNSKERPIEIEDGTYEPPREFRLFERNATYLARIQAGSGWLDDDAINNSFQVIETAVGRRHLRFVNTMDSNFEKVLGSTKAKILLPTFHERTEHTPEHWTIGVIPESRYPLRVYDSMASAHYFQQTAKRIQQVLQYFGTDINLDDDVSYRSPIMQRDGHSCGIAVFLTGVHEALNWEVPQGQIHNGLWRSTIHTMLVPLTRDEALIIKSLELQRLELDESGLPLDLPLFNVTGCDPSTVPADQALQVYASNFLNSAVMIAKSMDELTKRTSHLAPPIQIFKELQQRAIENFKARMADNACDDELYAIMEAAVRIKRVIRLLEAHPRKMENARQLMQKIEGLKDSLVDFIAS